MPPPGRLSWSLEEVLSALDGVDSRHCPIKDLNTTIFLISLASGGWINEISALHWEPDFAYVSSSGSLVLSPGPDFLTKNEDPSLRHQPLRNSPIPGDDYSFCPIATIQVYLQCTADYQTGSLFRYLLGKSLSLSGTRCCPTSLIKRFNLDSNP